MVIVGNFNMSGNNNQKSQRYWKYQEILYILFQSDKRYTNQNSEADNVNAIALACEK